MDSERVEETPGGWRKWTWRTLYKDDGTVYLPDPFACYRCHIPFVPGQAVIMVVARVVAGEMSLQLAHRDCREVWFPGSVEAQRESVEQDVYDITRGMAGQPVSEVAEALIQGVSPDVVAEEPVAPAYTDVICTVCWGKAGGCDSCDHLGWLRRY